MVWTWAAICDNWMRVYKDNTNTQKFEDENKRLVGCIRVDMVKAVGSCWRVEC